MEIHKVLNFLEKLEQNNSKKWMDQYRVYYEESRFIFKEVIQQMINNISLFDSSINDQRVEDCLFRINRNQRFHKTDTYKNYFSAEISKEGRHSIYSGYYLQIEPGNKSFIGAGIYKPDNNILKKIREGISYRGKEINDILNQDYFKRTFYQFKQNKLKKAPKGYEEDHPNIDLIKNKDFIFFREFKDHEVLSENFLPNIIQYCYYLKVFNQFLNTIILESVEEKEFI